MRKGEFCEPGRQQAAARAVQNKIMHVHNGVAETGPRNPAARKGTAPSKQRALLVYPELPPSYWDFRYTLELLGKSAPMPPLGLLTVAAMFPEDWELRLVDMNIQPLDDEDLKWADLVLTSSMVVQQSSLRDVLARCRALAKPVVAGGPHPTSFSAEIAGADSLLLGEVEAIFPRFLADWQAGLAGPVYRPQGRPELTITPVPRFDLINLEAYASMALQFSRGCPYDCEFCDITHLFGRVTRTKSNAQMLAELDRLYELGWRSSVFIVDDNFIGNRREARRLLPAVASWQRERGYPFDLYTEASADLAKHEALMDGMVDAGFTMVFLGIESPNPEALRRTRKLQNTARGEDEYLLRAVHRIQEKGLEVTGGFILGLDGDGPEVFDAQVDFVERAGIPIAMVGLLTALRGSHLYTRLEQEGRLLSESTGNNVEIALNFEPELERKVLIDGYCRVLSTLYDCGLESYFKRCLTLLARLGPRPRPRRSSTRSEISGFLRSVFLQLFSRQGPAYLKFFARGVLVHPSQFADAAYMAMKGLHFQRFTQQTLAAHAFQVEVDAAYGRLKALTEGDFESSHSPEKVVRRHCRRARKRLRSLYRRLRPEFRRTVPDLTGIETALRDVPRELPILPLVRRWTPRVRAWFTGPAWHRALRRSGYAPAEIETCALSLPTVALAPIIEQGRLRRSIEQLFRELGIHLESTVDQFLLLGEEGLAKIDAVGEPEARLYEYLRAIAKQVDILVVPLSEGSDAVGEYVQVLATRAAKLPRLVCVGLEGGRRELQHRLIELGTALTGDAVRAEIASARACAFI